MSEKIKYICINIYIIIVFEFTLLFFIIKKNIIIIMVSIIYNNTQLTTLISFLREAPLILLGRIVDRL